MKPVTLCELAILVSNHLREHKPEGDHTDFIIGVVADQIVIGTESEEFPDDGTPRLNVTFCLHHDFNVMVAELFDGLPDSFVTTLVKFGVAADIIIKDKRVAERVRRLQSVALAMSLKAEAESSKTGGKPKMIQIVSYDGVEDPARILAAMLLTGKPSSESKPRIEVLGDIDDVIGHVMAGDMGRLKQDCVYLQLFTNLSDADKKKVQSGQYI